MEQQGIIVSDRRCDVEVGITTSVYFAEQGGCVARLLLGDRIRPGLKSLLKELKPTRSILLSGDSEKAVAAVGKECDFNSWHYGSSPLEKREFIEHLKKQGEVVCMIGDGINDAPALTSAQVGMSVVSATDISVQVSDLLLTTDRIEIVSNIRRLAKLGRQIIRQNLFWAFFYNTIGIFLAAFGVLSPIFATFAMAASSLTVLYNAKRVR
jgi:P-type E1-E2 ATPase